MGNQTSLEEEIIIKCGLEQMVKQFFEDYIIVWHDPNVDSQENKQYIAQLEKFCQVRTFTEWGEASIEIQQTKAHCHVITSGTNGEFLVRELEQNQRVSGVYVFCRNKEYHESWAKNYQKISCIETKIQSILNQIKENLMKWYKEASSFKINLPAFAPIFNDWDKSGMNNLHRYLKVIPNFKSRLQAKKDFLELSKAIYSNQNDANLIALFEKNYNQYDKKETLNWYTQESFLYRVTNKCLRIATSDSIQYCRLLLRDIEQAIKDQYQEKSKNFSGLLFRGAYISEGEWSSLQNNVGKEIEMHGFLSASKDKNVALNFLRDPSKMVFITILVPKGPPDNGTEQGFAEVEEFSRFPQEQEILFNVRSRFTVLETEEDKYFNKTPCRHLVLLYGAQGFRKFVTEKNPYEPVSTYNDIRCKMCQAMFLGEMFYLSLEDHAKQIYCCQKCLGDFVEIDSAPLLCVTRMERTMVPGLRMTYPEGMKLPMYGYKCLKCEVKKKRVYLKCTQCYHVSCEDCYLESLLSQCLEKGHCVILESTPFSLWCDKMSAKELDHFKFQNQILEGFEIFQQGDMYVESQKYQKAIEFYTVFIEKNKEKKKDPNLPLAYNKIAQVYKHQAEHKKALEFYGKALGLVKSLYGENHLHVAGCLSNIGQVYESQAEYQRALEFYLSAVEIIKSCNGASSLDVAVCLTNIGNVYEKQAEYKKALEYYFRALEIEKLFYGENHPSVATSYNNIGEVYCSKAEYQKAQEYYLKGLEIEKLLYGENHPSVATCYNDLGNLYSHQSEYPKALEYYEKALYIRKAFYGNNHPTVASSYSNMGSVCEDQSESERALEFYGKALEIDKLFYGEEHPTIATSYSKMGQTLDSLAKYKEALECYGKALKIDKKYYGENHPNVALYYSKIGSTFDNQGEYEKALEYYGKALEINKLFYEENHPKIAIVQGNMGNVYDNQANYEKALEYYGKALEIDREYYGEKHPKVAISCSNIGTVYEKRGEYQKALEYHLRALEIEKAFYGDIHLSLASSESNIGHVYRSLAEFNKAMEHYTRAFEICKLSYKDDHPHIAVCYNNFAMIYLNKGEYKKALEYCSKALEIDLRFNEDSHISVATDHNRHGKVYNKMREYEKALEHYLRALEIGKLCYGENHPSIVDSMIGLGKTYFLQGEYEKALEYLFKAIEMKKLGSNSHPDIANIYCNIGNAYGELKEESKALEYHLKALEMRKQIFCGENHPDIAESYFGIGNVLKSQGKQKEALEYYSKSLEIRKMFFEDGHPDLISVSNQLTNMVDHQ